MLPQLSDVGSQSLAGRAYFLPPLNTSNIHSDRLILGVSITEIAVSCCAEACVDGTMLRVSWCIRAAGDGGYEVDLRGEQISVSWLLVGYIVGSDYLVFGSRRHARN